MPYIKNENDEVFNVTENNFEFVDNIVKCKYSFDLNTFNATFNLYLIIPTNNNENIVLELNMIK
ncbi:MAG: hypothetical protein J6J60_06520 [Clostridia bacterium]|nr:hypothetical protein [Clostridia bacterium]